MGASSVAASGNYREASTSSASGGAAGGGRGGGGGGRSAAVVRITQMEAGMETKLAAFVQWAGPMVLAALGIAPSECGDALSLFEG